MTKTPIKASKELLHKLNMLPIEAVDTVFPGDVRRTLSRIINTTTYLTEGAEHAYETEYSALYYHNLQIPPNHFVAGENILKIVKEASILDTEEYIAILNTTVPEESMGTCIYVDGKLYAHDMGFRREKKVIKDLLQLRSHGDTWFNCVTVVDRLRHKTQYYASETCKKRHMSILGKTYTGLGNSGLGDGVTVTGTLTEYDSPHDIAILEMDGQPYSVNLQSMKRVPDDI